MCPVRQDSIHTDYRTDKHSVSPNGIIYAKQHLRRSLLAKMLSEILNTRVMVKQGMKAAKGDKVSALARGLPQIAEIGSVGFAASFERKAAWLKIDGRKFGWQFLECEEPTCFRQNVTYGYTGASFSGRMPCVEIADSIVQTGRETLEKVS
jgi:DNA polymerase zeta